MKRGSGEVVLYCNKVAGAAVMPIKGHIEGGKIVLDEPVSYPDGTQVSVDVLPVRPAIHPEVLKISGILPHDIDVREEYLEGQLRKHQ